MYSKDLWDGAGRHPRGATFQKHSACSTHAPQTVTRRDADKTMRPFGCPNGGGSGGSGGRDGRDNGGGEGGGGVGGGGEGGGDEGGGDV